MKKIIEAATMMHENITSGKEINEGYASEKKTIASNFEDLWGNLDDLADDTDNSEVEKMATKVSELSAQWDKIARKVK